MATANYITGRRRYQRPQAMLWANNSGTLVETTPGGSKIYVPTGLEVGQDVGSETNELLYNQFIILSDDNRQEIDFRPVRIEKRERMINGRMRSYHIADKLQISTSWQMLPSRSYFQVPEFNATTGKSPHINDNNLEFTTDGGAGGVEILDWYENHKGPFWVYLSYDKYKNFKNEDGNIDNDSYAHLPQYNQLIEMYFTDFNYTVVKRGGSNFDFWNITVTLEEV
jgi:hypothetical protein